MFKAQGHHVEEIVRKHYVEKAVSWKANKLIHGALGGLHVMQLSGIYERNPNLLHKDKDLGKGPFI